MVVKFKKPYTFEGKEYVEVDLSGLENLKSSDLIQADKMFIELGNFAAVNEMSIGYACIVASLVAGKPIDFFMSLPAKEGVKVKTLVSNFLLD